MKTSTYKYLCLSGAIVFLIGCSTKRDSFVNRNYHAVTTEYNVLYNGNLALDAGVEQLKTTYTDNFWELLPVERMQPVVSKEIETSTSAIGAGGTTSGGKDKKSSDPRGELESKISDVKGKADSKIAQGKDLLSKANIGVAGAGPAAASAPGAAPGGKANDGRNPNFVRAEEKATKAIQKHAMNIGGRERNMQMDEAHLLLGKSRYYENRYIPSLEAFNYILYKYPNSDKIFEAKVWREKTNLRLDNEAIAIKNLKLLLKEKDMDQQIFADANAMLAQAYILNGSQDSAVAVLRKAAEFTKQNEEKARYHFILGQLYENQKRPDSAFAEFQKVINMKRKSPRRYVIQAHARQAAQFDYKNGDTLAFMEKYTKLLEDRENRPYLDVLNHQVGLFYDGQGKDNRAIDYYDRSLRSLSQDKYLIASNHRNIAEIYFKRGRYSAAGTYYDSTMVFMDSRSREFKRIKKKRDNLADVIKYENIAQTNDSILNIVALSEAGKAKYFEDYIAKIKEQDAREKARLENEAQKAENLKANASISNNNFMKTDGIKPAGDIGAPKTSGGKFYFYNPSTVSYGILEFKKQWGNRPHTDNWRWSSEMKNLIKNDEETAATDTKAEEAKKNQQVEVRYTTDFYIKQLPTSQVVIDSLARERNFAYYQLGTIYKEKFKEYQRAADKLEKLLVSNPEERLILPANYNLYKIYEIIDPAKAAIYKNKILSEYPDSRYAEIIKNPAAETDNSQSPEAVYDNLFKKYSEGQTREAYALVEKNIDTYTGEEIASKFELLKANIVGRLQGVEEYKKTLNFVALNYPNSEEGKKAEEMLKTDIPNLEKVAFGAPSLSWKIVFKFENPEDPKIKPLLEKIQKFIKEGYNNNITWSNDIYTMNQNFIVIHGFNSKLAAQDAVSVLQDYKTYKITEAPYIISTEDYKVVQIKKNFTEFLAIK